MMYRSIAFASACALAAPALAQTATVSGDAVKGLVSAGSKGEVHLLTDPSLLNRRLVLKVVVVNLSGAAAPFAPTDVAIATPDGSPIAQATRDAILGRPGGKGGAYETSEAHSAAAMPMSPNGQMDVSNYTGGMGGSMGGVPSSQLDRSQQDAAGGAAAAQLDAALLKPMTIPPRGADGGQVITDVIRRSKVPQVSVTVTFAGEPHRFLVDVPR